MSIDNFDPDVARESKKNPIRNVAVVGLFNSEGCILLVRTKRFPNHWQPIGGGMTDTDSTPIETVRRELIEEINLNLAPEQFKFQLVTNYDFGKGKVYFYSAILPKNAHLEVDSSEIAEIKWFKLKSVKSLQVFPATEKFIIHLEHRRRAT